MYNLYIWSTLAGGRWIQVRLGPLGLEATTLSMGRTILLDSLRYNNTLVNPFKTRIERG